MSTLVVLLCFNPISKVVGFSFFTKDTSHETFKVMSWNVRLFDLYNWSDSRRTKSKMFSFLREQQPDIVSFQEFYHQDIPGYPFVTKDSLRTFLKAKNIHEAYTNILNKHHYFGLATFTKYPIVNKGEISFRSSPSNLCMYTDVLINKDTVRIYNVHLASIRLSSEDYTFLAEYSNTLKESKPLDPIKEGSWKILKRFKQAYEKRAEQVNKVLKHIGGSPYKTILLGDFNDTPTSYAYNELISGRRDAFLANSWGIGGTFEKFNSIFRIDYIMPDTSFISTDFTTHKVAYSDHYPITAQIEIP